MTSLEISGDTCTNTSNGMFGVRDIEVTKGRR